MKKLMLTLALAFMAILAVNAAEKTVVLDLNSISMGGKYNSAFSPTFAQDITLTVVKEMGDEMEVVVSVPFEQDEVINIKSVNYMEVLLSYWDKDGESFDLSPIPFDMSQAADLIKFAGTKNDENTRVKCFRFKGMITKAEWKAYNAAESHFLNVFNVSLTVRP
ncbi:MAG: hypothetical protein MJZ74_01145 [Muribaculaceae bacterium]|nr:hypothetical protein [Muribaculaceae bacterium]